MVDEANIGSFLACANPECRVAETGRCLEGIELDSCPHYGKEVDEEEAEAEDDYEESVSNPSIYLPGAEALTPIQGASFLRAGEARVIVFLGPSDSGKTSLIASVYDLFQEGPINDIEFARSKTFHAFEHACHDARAASRRSEPHMNRTPIGEVRFYHLELGVGSSDDSLVLLLGDRAGEEYREASNDPSSIESFSELLRADSLTVLVDGVRLLSAGARHNLRAEIINMLQALSEEGGLRGGARLALVLTKVDAVQDSEHAERAIRDFEGLFSDVQRLFGSGLSEVKSFQIAASPKTTDLRRGEGIPELLAFWLIPAAVPFTQSTCSGPSLKRNFARLMPLDEPME